MNGWVNNREAGDMRRHLAHYDVTVSFATHSSIMYIIKMQAYVEGDTENGDFVPETTNWKYRW